MKKIIVSILLLFVCTQSVISAHTMTYMYGGTTTTYKNYIDRATHVLDEVCVDYFDIVDGGMLSCPKMSHEFVNYAHENGLTVTALISNHWDRNSGIAALSNMYTLTDLIAVKVYEYNLDGVNVDIQNVTQVQREGYVEFVQLLRGKLPDKIVSVSVAANPNGWTTGWHGSYDYAALAANSDYLMIMAYDESWYGSEAGPVASYTFVKRSLDYALRYTTADKLVLGVPFYGRYWREGDAAGGSAMTQKDVENLKSNYMFAEAYMSDEGIQSSKVTIIIQKDDVKPKLWGGTTLSEGRYTVYYDNKQSLLSKLELANMYGLKGTGSWAIGQEDAYTWEMYAEFLEIEELPQEEEPKPELNPDDSDKVLLEDIDAHWAKSSIIIAAEKGWLRGRENNLFAPDEFLTRAECAAVIARVSDISRSPMSNDFLDTAKHWARDYIADVRYSGIVEGYDNMFYPDRYITREEFCVIVDRTFNIVATVNFHNNIFSDITPQGNPWAYNAIIKLAESEIINGYEDGSFRSGGHITRAETAAILGRISGTGTKPRNRIFEEKQGIDGDVILPR